MSSPFTIADAKSEDEHALAAMMRGLNEAENEFVPNRDLTDAAALEHVRYLMGCVKQQGGFALVGRKDDVALGFAIGLVETEEGAYVLPGQRGFGFLSDIFVAPEVRRRGLARALVAAAEARFRDLGVTEMRLNVLGGNVGAMKFYEKAGFAPYEQILSKLL
ncbi:N-acetyltransferase family protein [Hyphococcus sp.]|jgi:ribosomal protein S18 acetylase RimI-like enzyme|uniref:GNAT family N-acetyltransferase n=1 Tax=Hyphococcus sp. TaxID=2038636 RepID=UPI003D13D055